MAEILILEGGMIALFALLWAIPSTRKIAHRLVRTAKTLSRDPRMPRWAKCLFVVSCLPIPGPFDEIMGAFTALVVWRAGYSAIVREAWATC